MNNRGITIVECIVTISFMTIAFVGIFTFLFSVKRQIEVDKYKVNLILNYQTLIMMYESDPLSFYDNVKKEYNNQTINLENDHLVVIFNQNYPLLNKQISFDLYVYDEEDKYILMIKCLNCLDEMEKLNNEKYSQRLVYK